MALRADDMAFYDLLLHNGTIVTTDGQAQADIGIQGETIAAIGPSLAGQASQTYDASGKYVFPGFVDPHVHLSLPIGGGLVSSDDFTTGTIAAACGGTTTIIDFTTQERGISLQRAVHDRLAQADGKAAIDYSLHLTVMDASPRTLAELRKLAASGFPSIKLYMTYPSMMVTDQEMLAILETAADYGVLTLVHAENHALVAYLTRRLLDSGHTAPRYHAASRPAWVEGEAANRAITLARAAGAPLYIVHVSCRESLLPIQEARKRGQAVFGETCPHYLLLSEDNYEQPGFLAAKYVMTPPLRPRDNWSILWRALATGDLDVVATDHCPWFYATQKVRGQERFDRIPGGVAGVETRIPLLHSEGVGKGRLSLERFVAACATNPARLFGLYPRKGTLAVGSDADIVVFDPQRTATLHQETLHQRVDYTVFEGWSVTGLPVLTISRGCIVAREGEYVGHVGHGRFVARRRTMKDQ